ncbi:MAG: mevalonate kinase [Candidatus Aenigmatarchaeota archaeon]
MAVDRVGRDTIRMSDTITASAPMKIHLIGEHSVVYGEPAIIAAIGTRVRVKLSESDNIVIKDDQLKENFEFSVDEVLSFTKSARNVWKECNAKNNFGEIAKIASDHAGFKMASIGEAMLRLKIKSGVFLEVDRDFPPLGGLGSSAAYAVALPFALARLNGKSVTREEANDIAFEIEKFSHGSPSGGDNTVCCFGGLVWFQKSSPKAIIESLDSDAFDNFVLVYTGEPEKSRASIIQGVKDLEEDYRNRRIKALGAATVKMRDAIVGRNFDSIKNLINLAQRNLAELGVSTRNIDRIAQAVVGVGGAAKLCGAGGGGFMLCCHENKNKLVNLIKNLGYDPIEISLAAEGVRIEK